MTTEGFPRRGAGGEILTPEMFAENREFSQPELNYLDFTWLLAQEWVRLGYWTEENSDEALERVLAEMRARGVSEEGVLSPLPDFGGLLWEDVMEAGGKIKEALPPVIEKPEVVQPPFPEVLGVPEEAVPEELRLKNEAYISEGERLIDYYVSVGGTGWTPAAGEYAKSLLANQINTFGIQPNTLLYNEIVTLPQERLDLERFREGQRRLPPITEEEQLGRHPDPEVRRLEDILRAREFRGDVEGAEEIRTELGGRVEEVGLQARGLEFLEGREAFISRRGELTGEEQRELVSAGMEAMAGEPPPKEAAPFEPPELEQLTLGGTRLWRQRFGREYASIVRSFRAKPTRTKETWASLLEKAKRESREEFAALSEFQRGERPQFFAPRIKTVTR